MTDWKDKCPDNNRCRRVDCPRCSATKILPPDKRGSLKPNRRSGVGREVGYRVYPGGGSPDKTESFSTPDVAIATAKQRAKRAAQYYVVSRNGTQWLMVKWDGSMEELK